MNGFLYRLKGGTAAALAAVNPIPAKREPVAEWDTGNIKIGDGTTAWNSLPYAGFHSELPAQAGNSGKVLGTDGVIVSWVTTSAVPAGGAINYVLAKASAADGDTHWVAQTGGAATSGPHPFLTMGA